MVVRVRVGVRVGVRVRVRARVRVRVSGLVSRLCCGSYSPGGTAADVYEPVLTTVNLC